MILFCCWANWQKCENLHTGLNNCPECPHHTECYEDTRLYATASATLPDSACKLKTLAQDTALSCVLCKQQHQRAVGADTVHAMFHIPSLLTNRVLNSTSSQISGIQLPCVVLQAEAKATFASTSGLCQDVCDETGKGWALVGQLGVVSS